MAKFTSYRTYYELYSEVAPKGGRKSPKDYYTDALSLIAKTLVNPESLRPLCPSEDVFNVHVEHKEDWPLCLATQEAEYDWYALKRPTFKILPGLVDALAHTSIDVESERVKMPFPSFKIELPAGNTLGESCGAKGFDGLLVTTSDIINFEAIEGGQAAKLHIFGTRRGDTDPRVYAPLGYKGYCRATAGFGTFPLTHHHSMFALPLTDESLTVQELLAKYDAQMMEHDKDFSQRLVRRRVLSLVVATMLIAISDDKRLIKPEKLGVRHRLKAEKARKRGDKTAGLANKGFLVGADIKLPKDVQRAISKPAGTGRELDYGHIRSGHLRLQPYGKQDEKKRYKVIFIAPTIVRPDLPMKPKLTDRAVKGV